MKTTLQSGEVIEYRLADALSGPDDCLGKLHCNSTSAFVRREGGEWLRMKLPLHRIRQWLEISDSWAEFCETHALGMSSTRPPTEPDPMCSVDSERD